MSHGIDENSKRKIIAVISALIPEATIYLFGSRARGTQSQWSDIDIALDAGEKLSPYAVGEIVSMFEASSMPYKVQVVDFQRVSSNMQKSILDEGIIWKK